MKFLNALIFLFCFLNHALPAQSNASKDHSLIAEIDSSRYNLRKSLINLYWTEKELKQINNFISGKVFFLENATEQNFKKSIAEAGIIHLATHTLIDDKNPLYSKMVFSEDGQPMEDGLLNTYEIYDLKTQAQMVVLSGCNTGYGKLVKGEGNLSLARGFMYAGVPSVVMSLWQVDDQSTFKIMNKFYENISLNKRKDEALREAKLNYIKNSNPLLASPYYWSGFVVHGNLNPIGKPDKSKPVLYTIVVLCIIILGYGYRRVHLLKKWRILETKK